jgi:hypothetical protein
VSRFKRYRPTVRVKPLTAMQSYTVAEMEEADSGEYVLTSDFDALVAEVIQVSALLVGNGDLAELLAARLRAAFMDENASGECPTCGGHGITRHEGSLDIVDECPACQDCRPGGAP